LGSVRRLVVQGESLTWTRNLTAIICLVTIGLGFLWQGTPVGADGLQTDPDLVIRIVPPIPLPT
jgi:hypothetical protein